MVVGMSHVPPQLRALGTRSPTGRALPEVMELSGSGTSAGGSPSVGVGFGVL